MTVSLHLFDSYVAGIARTAGGRFPGSNVMVALVDSGWTPGSAQTDVAAILAHEVASGGGYWSCDDLLSGSSSAVKVPHNMVVYWDAAGGRAICSMDPVVWSSLNRTSRYALFIEAPSGLYDTAVPLFWIDFGTNASPAGSSLTLVFADVASGGVISVEAA